MVQREHLKSLLLIIKQLDCCRSKKLSSENPAIHNIPSFKSVLRSQAAALETLCGMRA